jgi:hypothetical protein
VTKKLTLLKSTQKSSCKKNVLNSNYCSDKEDYNSWRNKKKEQLLEQHEGSLVTNKKLLVKKNNSTCCMKKINLVRKPYVATYNDYNIKPRNLYNHIELHRFLNKCLSYVLKNNLRPQKRVAENILNYWNSVDHPRFTHHNRKSKIKDQIILVITYYMHKNKFTEKSIKNAIDNFSEISNINNLLKYCKKLKILDSFLWNSNSRHNIKWIFACNCDLNTAFERTHTQQPAFPKTMNRTKKYFLKYFFPEIEDREIGEKLFQSEFYKFRIFSDKMVEDHQNLNMCSLSIDQYLDNYFDYASEQFNNLNSKKNLNIWRIIGDAVKMNFVLWMRSEPGFEDFYRKKG